VFQLAVIIVEYKSTQDVRECIQSLLPFADGVRLTPLVLSNSQYGAAQVQDYKKEFGQDTFHSTGTNAGYAGGVNLGLQLAPRADFYLILNPDARWIGGTLRALMERMAKEPKLGILGPGIYNEEGIQQPTARAFPKPTTALLTRTWLARTGRGRKESTRYFQHSRLGEGPFSTDWVSGGAFIISRAAVSLAGPMDERYFMYMEDVDWCRTARATKLLVIHDPRWSVCHAGRHASLSLALAGLARGQLRHHIKSMLRYHLKWKRLRALGHLSEES
jgi:N-acetylglucosaminyl-diphospho-decaprenol L-rhamnosyltransferase